MFIKRLFFVFGLFFVHYLYSFSVNRPWDAIQLAGNGLVFHQQSSFESVYFPVTSKKQVSTSILNHYSFAKLYDANVIISFPYKKLQTHFAMRTLQHSLISNSEFLTIFSYSFYHIGAGFIWRGILEKIENDEETRFVHFLDADFSFQYQNSIHKIYLSNVTNSKGGSLDFPQTLSYELNYLISEVFQLSFGFEKETDFDYQFRTGVCYPIMEKFMLYASHQWEPMRIGGGIKLEVKKLKISYAVRTHEILDLTHGITIHYTL